MREGSLVAEGDADRRAAPERQEPGPQGAPKPNAPEAIASAADECKRLTDEQIENLIDEANRAFNRYQSSGPRGQLLTTADDWKHWLARAIESAVRASAVAGVPAGWQPIEPGDGAKLSERLKNLADYYACAQGGGAALHTEMPCRRELFAEIDAVCVRLDSPPLPAPPTVVGAAPKPANAAMGDLSPTAAAAHNGGKV